MAIKKGPKMLEEIVKRRASGKGIKTIASELKIAKNTVKTHLRNLAAYEVTAAQQLLQNDSLKSLKQNSTFTPHWSGHLDWSKVISAVESGVPIKEYWENHVVEASTHDLKSVPYETFWREFRRKCPNIDIHYHKQHEAGMRAEIDYKGDTPGLGFIDLTTNKFIACRFFGQVLCCSRLFFPYATINEKQISWMEGVVEAFKYFGGSSHYIVVDNSRCTVDRADWFDPDLNQEFNNFCDHYGTGVLAARPRRPKDKNLIEVHLGVFWRWIRRKLREKQFFSLGELNRYLREMANVFNDHYQRRYGSSRRERFEAIERITLKPLPLMGYELGEWKKARLHEDCHIQYKYNFYSAPYQLRGRELDVRVTSTHIEIFHEQSRVAIHAKKPLVQRGTYSTIKEHLPERLQALEDLSIKRQIYNAKLIGNCTGKIIENLLEDTTHPLRFLRRTMGILRFKGRYGADKLERACELLLRHGRTKPAVKEVEAMIKSPNLENTPRELEKIITRKANPHLRGQRSFTLQGENDYGPTDEDDRATHAGAFTAWDAREFSEED
ncbi:MAG: IS21 family transposase [Oligoflexia bacterium]|nr:IS21 family transposase [Oligoflexia bacterium]